MCAFATSVHYRMWDVSLSRGFGLCQERDSQEWMSCAKSVGVVSRVCQECWSCQECVKSVGVVSRVLELCQKCVKCWSCQESVKSAWFVSRELELCQV